MATVRTIEALEAARTDSLGNVVEYVRVDAANVEGNDVFLSFEGEKRTMHYRLSQDAWKALKQL